MLRVKVSDDAETVAEVRAALKADPHCPCRIEKTPDSICMCKEFREQNVPGPCHCGLYVKVDVEEEKKDEIKETAEKQAKED